MRSHARASIAVVALFAFFAIASSAFGAYEEIGSFADNGSGEGGSGSEAGQLSNPNQAAVNDATGDLYVADTANNRVEVFKPNASGGEYDSEVPIAQPTGLAIDQDTGDVYVANAAGISKFDSSLNPITVGWSAPAVTGNLAVDPSSGDLLLADTAGNLIRRYDSSGTPDATTPTFATERPIDVAANSAGQIYVVATTGDLFTCASSEVVRYSAAGASEEVVGSLEAPSAVAVDPDDDSVAIATHTNGYNCTGPSPEVAFFDSTSNFLEAIELSGTTFATVPGLAAQGGGSGRVYAVTKSPNNDGFGSTRVTALEKPLPVPPTVTTGPPSAVNPASATLTGSVDPGLLETSYSIEYGTSTAYGARFPGGAGAVLSGEGARAVSFQLEGLKAETTYHYRYVAENSLGKVEGLDRVFKTRELVAPVSHGAYELVSPADKNGGEVQGVNGGFGTVQSTPSGDGAVFTSQVAFSDVAGSPAINRYRSIRGLQGWSTDTLEAPQQPYARQFGQASFAFSEDLSQALVMSQDGLAPGAVDGNANLYIRSQAGYQLIASSGDFNFLYEFFNPGSEAFSAATADFSHVLFNSTVALTPGAAPGHPNLYEWTDGELRLVDLPPGEVAADPEYGGVLASPDPRDHAMSTDGERIFFTRAGTTFGRLYLRIGGAMSIPVSESQRQGDPPGAMDATFGGASADGSVAYFTSDTPLTEDAATGTGYGDLYRFDVESRVLTDLTVATDPTGAEVMGVLGVSDDGETVYFTAKASLAPGAISGEANLYVRHNGETKFITIIDGALLDIEPGVLSPDFALVTGNPSLVTISPSGRYLGFNSHADLTDFPGRGLAQAYLYDSQAGKLSCASCDPTGVPALGNSQIAATTGTIHGNLGNYYPRSLDDQGTLFFDTPNSLVIDDRNGRSDAYEYVNGHAELISTGHDSSDSFFSDASSDGSSVFFKTRERLVSQDTDDKFDLYVARQGGGFPAVEPPPPPCQGEGCQGQGAPPPSGANPASGTFAGPANPKPRRHKPKARRKQAKPKHHRKGKRGKSKHGHAKQRRSHR